MKNNMFLITPMNQRVYLNRGEDYHGEIRVTNPAAAEEEFCYAVEVMPYGVVGEEYDMNLTNESRWTRVAGWTTVENSNGCLMPNEVGDVRFTIHVPEDAMVGAQTAALVVRQDEKDGNNSGMKIENVFEMASILYAQVLGIEEHEATILSVEIPGFATTSDVMVSATLDNHGNVFEEARTKIRVKDLISGQVILPTMEVSGEYDEIVMPDTTRKVQRKIDGLPMLGLVQVEYRVTYNGEEMVVEKNVAICPIWFMMLMVVVFAMLVATIAVLARKHRRRMI